MTGSRSSPRPRRANDRPLTCLEYLPQCQYRERQSSQPCHDGFASVLRAFLSRSWKTGVNDLQTCDPLRLPVADQCHVSCRLLPLPSPGMHVWQLEDTYYYTQMKACFCFVHSTCYARAVRSGNRPTVCGRKCDPFDTLFFFFFFKGVEGFPELHCIALRILSAWLIQRGVPRTRVRVWAT